MAKVITIANQKGGVAKTTTALCLADVLIHSGAKVLLVDTDAQCNSSTTYQAAIDGEYTLSDLLSGDCTIEETIQVTNYGHIIPADQNLPLVEEKLKSLANGMLKIKKILSTIKNNYDYIIIDTPPNLGALMINSLVASDGVIIPIYANSKYSLDGIERLYDTIDNCRELNTELQIYGILATNYDTGDPLSSSTYNLLKSNDYPMFKNFIRKSRNIPSAQAQSSSLIELYPNGIAVEDYKNLVNELLEVI